MKVISVIIPCFQNEGSIPALGERLDLLNKKMTGKAILKYVFVNDGSSDKTLSILLEFKKQSPKNIKIVNLTRNFGSYNAFLAGMSQSEGDCHVHLHADLQDPPELIAEMFDYYLKGHKLIIAYRQSREDGSLFSTLYHLMVKRFAIQNIPSGGFDLMLFDEAIRCDVLSISEKNTNIVYLISWLGYPYVAIPYTRRKREHGTSQWKFWKKVRLFVNTFFSFSDYPLYLLRFLCLLSIFCSFGLAIYLLLYINTDESITNILLLVAVSVILLVFGITVGVLAEYVSRIHETVRKRPNFVVDEII